MSRATVEQLVHAAKVVAVALDAERGVYCLGGRLAVPVGRGWDLAISADDAERLRVEACFRGCVVVTMWVIAGNDDRLARLALAARGESAALAV
jgi:hypothetical protein